MGRFTGTLALMLAESPVLPFNVTRYTRALNQIVTQLKQSNAAIDFGPCGFVPNAELLQSIVFSRRTFGKSNQRLWQCSKILRWSNEVDGCEQVRFLCNARRWKRIDGVLFFSSPYEIRIYNDQLLQLERAFLNPLGQGGADSDMKCVEQFDSHPLCWVQFLCPSRHVIYAPAKTNKYAASGFPSIGDALANGDANEIKHQIAVATYFVRGALATLKNFHQFINAWIWRRVFSTLEERKL